MDIEKAIEWQEKFKQSYKNMPLAKPKVDEVCDITVAALRELQLYRQIGTVERFAALESQMKPHVIDGTCCPQKNCNKCDRYRKELEEYHKIGTVEECRAAREKQIAQTPDYKEGYSDGDLTYNTWICPNCGEPYNIKYDRYDYCPKCGQHIAHEDWETEV